MLQWNFRTLVPLSALALLGWCWYTYRRRRRLCQWAKEELLKIYSVRKQSMVENVGTQEAAADKKTLDLKTVCHVQLHKKQDSDQNLDHSIPQHSSTMNESSVLSETSCIPVLTSTPLLRLLKGIRPEPEGEVSRAQACLLLTEPSEKEMEIDDDTDKGHADFKLIAPEPRGIVCHKEQEVPITSSKQNEQAQGLCEADGLVNEDINAEEIGAIGGGILKRKGHSELRVTPQSQVQLLKDTDNNNVPGATEAAEESLSSDHKPSDRSSTFLAGKDSGFSHSEDVVETENAPSKPEDVEKVSAAILVSSETQDAISGISGKLSRQKADACNGTNGVQCVNRQSSFASKHGMQLMNLPHSVWNIEIPAHLVGRLIGKKGKYISSLKQSSGANIYVSTLPYTYEFQICHIEGSDAQVEKALALIRKKFKDLDLSNRLSSVQPAAVPALSITSWLLLPQDRPVEVIVPRVEAANYLFVQQHTHPSYYSLNTLTEQMLLCYCHSGCPNLPTPVEVGVLCAAPSPDGAWWRAQVIQHYKDSSIVQIRYVDYGGYETINLNSLKQIRSDFVSLPFQASEVMLESIAPLPGKDKFSFEAKEAVEEITRGVSLIIKVTGSQKGLPIVHMWRQAGEEMISVNGVLVERGLCSWLDSH